MQLSSPELRTGRELEADVSGIAKKIMRSVDTILRDTKSMDTMYIDTMYRYY